MRGKLKLFLKDKCDFRPCGGVPKTQADFGWVWSELSGNFPRTQGPPRPIILSMDRVLTIRADKTAGTRFYARIFSYFRRDWLLILALVGLIWLSLGFGTLQPAAVALLTDKVLSGKPMSNVFSRLLVDILPAGRLAKWFVWQCCGCSFRRQTT